jgi:hypothetical protein
MVRIYGVCRPMYLNISIYYAAKIELTLIGFQT